MQALQVFSRRVACSYGRPIRSLPVLAPLPVRLLAAQSLVPRAGKKQAPVAREPEPEPEEEFAEEEYEDEDPLASLNAAGKRRVQALKEVQNKYDELFRDYLKDLAQLQHKYSESYAPLFTERAEIVAGTKPVDKFDIEDDEEADEGIPDFWLNAISNSKAGAFVTDRDAEVLRYLTDVRYEVLTGEQRGFKLLFSFAENPHFSNTVLETAYLLLPEEDVVPQEFTGTKIDWKEGQDVTVEYQKKRVRGPKGKPPTFTTEKVPTDSFFNIFDPPKVPSGPEAEAMEEPEIDEIEVTLGDVYTIASAIRDKVVPRAVEWFTGEIALLDEEYDEEYDDEYEDE